MAASGGGISSTPAVTYQSSDWRIASVEKDGTVTANKEGTATITASCTVNGKQYTASCTVTVTAADTGAGTGTGSGTGTGDGTEQQETPYFHTPRHIYVAGTSAPKLYVYRNGREVDITSEATWTSESSLLKLTMSGNTPTVQLTAPGTGYITATWKGHTLRQEYQIVDKLSYVYLTGAYSGLRPGGRFSTSLCIYNGSTSASDCQIQWSAVDCIVVSADTQVAECRTSIGAFCQQQTNGTTLPDLNELLPVVQIRQGRSALIFQGLQVFLTSNAICRKPNTDR